MRVLMLSSTFHPMSGGAETYIRLLAQGVGLAGHDVTVVTDGSRLPTWEQDERADGYRVLRLSEFAADLDNPDLVKWRRMQYAFSDEFAQHISRGDYDLVHANSHETLVWGAMLALDASVPLVASLHEQSPDLAPFGRGRCLLSYQTLPVDAYLTASHFYDERAIAFGAPRDKTHLIYHGVQLPDIDPGVRDKGRRRFGINPANLLLVCAGRLDPRKAQRDLVDALPAIHNRVPGLRVLLAGRTTDSTYAASIHQRLREHGLEDIVSIGQNLTNNDMDEVFAAADIVVQPSLEEGLGLSVIEAMAWAKPVVVTDVVGLNEVVTHDVDGLVTPVSHPAALADAGVRIASDSALAARLGSAARVTVQRKFSQRTMVERTLAVYHHVVASRQYGGR